MLDLMCYGKLNGEESQCHSTDGSLKPEELLSAILGSLEVDVFSGPLAVGGKPLLSSIIHDICGRTAAEREMKGVDSDLCCLQ